MTYTSVRGMRDWWGQDVAHRRRIEQRSASIAACYGVSWIETPILESLGVFVKTLGESSDIVGKEMYTLCDRGGDTLVMRPEGTAPAIRALIQAGAQLPQKLMYTGPMFRYERPQKGRFRQHYQLGVEYLSREPQAALDVECLSLAHHIIKDVGVKDYTLHIGTLGSVEERAAYSTHLIEHLTPYKHDLSEDSQRRLTTNPLRIFDSKSPQDQEIIQDAPRLMNHLSAASHQFFENVCNGLSSLGIGYYVDDTLVRGLDYYGHTTFEFKCADHLGSQNAFGGGGRYDGLMSQMGSKQGGCGIGWAFGLDRLLLMIDSIQEKHATTFILSLGEDDTCQRIAYQLRQSGVACEVLLGDSNVSKKMQQAHKRGAAYTIVIGENERLSQLVDVKNMTTSVVEKVEISQLTTYLSRVCNV